MNEICDRLILEIARKFAPVPPGAPGIRFRSLKGGSGSGAVPGEARLLLTAPDYGPIRQTLGAYREETGYDVDFRSRGKSLEISVRDRSDGQDGPAREADAISILMEIAGTLPFAGDEIREFIQFYNTHIGHKAGGTLSAGNSCEPEAFPSVLGAERIDMTPEAAGLTLDICRPPSCTEDQICDAMMPVLNRYEIGMLKTGKDKDGETDNI